MEYLIITLSILAIVGMKRAMVEQRKAIDKKSAAMQARIMQERYRVAYTIASRDGQGERHEESGLLKSEAAAVARALHVYGMRVANISIERE